MAVKAHVELLEGGVTRWNRWRSAHAAVRPDLSGASFRQADLSGANLRRANLASSDFTYTFLSDADLSHADLTEGRFIETNFVRANLSHANLTASMLHGANLRDAKLRSARLHKAYLGGASFVTTDLRGANLTEADLTFGRLIEAQVEGSIFDDCQVYGIAAWNLKGRPKVQQRLTVTPVNEPVVAVDDLELAQFVYLLLNHENLRRILNSVTERGVLILGRFGGGGLDVLHAVAAELRAERYLPMIFDFARPRQRNYTETVQTLAGLSRFVVVDLSGPSVPQELQATVPHFKIPFVPILEGRRKPYALATDILEHDWVMKPIVRFAGVKDLPAALRPALQQAEARLAQRQDLLADLFGGRHRAAARARRARSRRS